MNGIYRISTNFDSIGAMGKSALDVALVSDILLSKKEQSRKLADSATKDQAGKGLSIAFVDIEKWRFPEDLRKFVPGYMEQTV
jgi:amidase